MYGPYENRWRSKFGPWAIIYQPCFSVPWPFPSFLASKLLGLNRLSGGTLHLLHHNSVFKYCDLNTKCRWKWLEFIGSVFNYSLPHYAIHLFFHNIVSNPFPFKSHLYVTYIIFFGKDICLDSNSPFVHS